MTIPPPTVRLLVCGSADRGDDGAPLSAVAHLLPTLQPELRQALEVRRCPQLDINDLLDVRPGESCVLVDTVVGVEPGAIVSLSLPELADRRRGVSPRSSHALPIDQVLGIADAVRGGLPPGTFVGVGGRWFGYGTVQSRSVRAALPRLERAIEAAIRDLALGPVALPVA